MTPKQLLEWAYSAKQGYRLPDRFQDPNLASTLDEILSNRGLRLCWCHPDYAHVILMSEDGVDR